MKILVAIVAAVLIVAFVAQADACHGGRARRQSRRGAILHAVTHPFGGALRGGCGNGACRP